MDLADGFEAALEKLADDSTCATLCSFRKGELLVRQGQRAPLFYIVRGRVRTYVLSGDGREKTLAIAGPGALVNEADFYLDRPSMANAEIFDTSADAYVISRVGLGRLLHTEPSLTSFLLESHARTTTLLAEEVINLSFRDVSTRVQLVLIRLASDHGVVLRDGVAINLRVTHEDIARLVGANRATVSACMSELQRSGFFEVVNRQVILAPWAVGMVLAP